MSSRGKHVYFNNADDHLYVTSRLTISIHMFNINTIIQYILIQYIRIGYRMIDTNYGIFSVYLACDRAIYFASYTPITSTKLQIYIFNMSII
jgi:hypothetical protein